MDKNKLVLGIKLELIAVSLVPVGYLIQFLFGPCRVVGLIALVVVLCFWIGVILVWVSGVLGAYGSPRDEKNQG